MAISFKICIFAFAVLLSTVAADFLEEGRQQRDSEYIARQRMIEEKRQYEQHGRPGHPQHGDNHHHDHRIWVRCNYTGATEKTCVDCKTLLICTKVGGFKIPCWAPGANNCVEGECAAEPSEECQPATTEAPTVTTDSTEPATAPSETTTEPATAPNETTLEPAATTASDIDENVEA